MSTKQKVRQAVWGVLLGSLLFASGVVAAYALLVQGNGSVKTFEGADVSFLSIEAEEVSNSTCVATKLSATTWSLAMTDARPGSTCGAVLIFKNSGNAKAYMDAMTFTAPAGITVVPAPADIYDPGQTNGAHLKVTNVSWPIGEPAALTFEIHFDGTP